MKQNFSNRRVTAVSWPFYGLAFSLLAFFGGRYGLAFFYWPFSG